MQIRVKSEKALKGKVFTIIDAIQRSLFEEIRRNQEKERAQELKLLQVHGTSKSVLAKL